MKRVDRREFLRRGGCVLAASALGSHGLHQVAGIFASPAPWSLDDAFLTALPGRMGEAEVPGISIAFGPRNRAAWARGFGVAEAGRERAVEPDTVFPAGSLSKPVLATIALQLEGEGVFDLDRPLREWLSGGDFPAGAGAERLTAHHALRHMSGLANWRFSAEAPFALEREPGLQWGYSGEGYVLVQRALETVTGEGLEGLARVRIFEPLGMHSSTFLWREDLEGRIARPTTAADHPMAQFADFGERRARALQAWAEEAGRDVAGIRYEDAVASDERVRSLADSLSGRPLPDVAPLPIVLVPNGAGSLWTTAPDYLRFLHAWLANPAWRERAFGRPADAGEGIRWGAGWGLEGSTQQPRFWHWGEGIGFRTFALGDPAAGEGIVVLTNGEEGLGIARLVVEAATGGSHAAFAFL